MKFQVYFFDKNNNMIDTDILDAWNEREIHKHLQNKYGTCQGIIHDWQVEIYPTQGDN